MKWRGWSSTFTPPPCQSVLWMAQVYGKPELFLHQRWVVTRSGDALATTMMRTQLRGPKYELVKTIAVKDAPVVEIYRLVSRFPARLQ